MSKDISSFRGAIEYLREQGQVTTIEGEVDPIYEVTGITKSLDGGPVLRFENLKGYPGIPYVVNLYSKIERICELFDAKDYKDLKSKCINGIRNPIQPRVVEKAPCQEMVITDNIDLLATLPVLKYTEEDSDRIFGGGNPLVTGKYFKNGTEIGFHRMHFAGKDYSTLLWGTGSHLDWAIMEHRGEGKIPLTVNVATPPAVLLIAGGGSNYAAIPVGSDELGIAGGIQGFPVDIVKAKTVDAYAVANSEWVMEGYIDTSMVIWESEEAEKLGREAVAPFFPEYHGHMGTAHKTYKFQVTAITHRNNPIFWSPLAHSFEGINLCKVIRDSCAWEIAERLFPGLVIDVNSLFAFRAIEGVIFQVKKRRRRDEGCQKSIIQATMGSVPAYTLVITVDEDVNIYSAEDVMWAIAHRFNAGTGLILGPPVRGTAYTPLEWAGAGAMAEARVGCLGIDATLPVGATKQGSFKRAIHPVDRVDLTKWLSKEQISKAVSEQCEYAKFLAEKGY